MIYIIITSYNEPKSTLKAVNSFLEQDIKEQFKIIVADPFEEVGDFLKKNIKNKNFEFFLDPGEGKTYCLNTLLERFYSTKENDIIIFTDGDVYVSKNSVKEIINAFKDKKIGCITGRPIPMDEPTNKYGYWAKVLYRGIDKVRKKLMNEKKFFQCSGYLFAIRNGVIKEIPVDVPEDAIVPYLFWKQNYSISYVENAEVYVKYPGNWKDWINQRVRTIKAHENIGKLYPDMPRTKSFFSEIKEGAIFVLMQPRSIREFIWTIELYFARLYIYYKSFTEIRKKEKAYDPGWRDVEIKSTNPFD
jgi:cellulose synthase/poly-beta-1,6-N-acetylglucosamine synthase-like glycosyltransferase